MALDTYAGLQASIADHLDDDLSAQIQDFIALAEARHKREIRIREMQAREELTLSEGSDADTDRFLSFSGLSSTFLDLKSLRLKIPTTTSGRMYYPPLEEVTGDQMVERAIKDARRPSSFHVWAEEIEFDSMADEDYAVELWFYTELTALSDQNTSNALLLRAPDVYLYGSLMASAPFLLNDERLKTWGDLYIQARDELNRTERESRRGGPLISRVRGATP